MGQCDRPKAVFAIFHASPDLKSVILRIDLVQIRPGAAMKAVVKLTDYRLEHGIRSAVDSFHSLVSKGEEKIGPFQS